MFFHRLFSGKRIIYDDTLIKQQGRAKLLYEFYKRNYFTKEQEKIVGELEELLNIK